MRKTNKQKGITLVALVITIVLLLILAGITISSLTQTSLFAKANEAKEKTEEAKLRENTILNGFAEGIEEIVGGSEETTYTAYTRGQTVTVEDKDGVEQSFYVLHDSSSSESTVTLLAKKNIGVKEDDTQTYLKQSDDATTTLFSETGGWTRGDDLNEYNNGSLKTDGSSAVYYAVQYGEKFEVGAGRLMTVEEAYDITELSSTGGISRPDWIKETDYWLGTAYSANDGLAFVYIIDKDISNGSLGYDINTDKNGYGVRPVIKISKSLHKSLRIIRD